ncbi:MAG: BspA family leucine-rich repeat surface protein [Clostridia bacterium]|nr:BspA family leucine-rich repeat surface protein [Clostridia bacterium]
MAQEKIITNKRMKLVIIALVAAIFVALGGLIAVFATISQGFNSNFNIFYDVGEGVAAAIRTEVYVPGQDLDEDGTEDGAQIIQEDLDGNIITNDNGYLIFNAPEQSRTETVKIDEIKLSPKTAKVIFYYTIENLSDQGYIKYDFLQELDEATFSNMSIDVYYYNNDVSTSASASTLNDNYWISEHSENLAAGDTTAVKVVAEVIRKTEKALCDGSFGFDLTYTANQYIDAGTVSKALWAENSQNLTTVVFDEYSSTSSETYTGVTLGEATDISVEQNGTVNLYTNGTTGYVLSHEPIMFPEDSSYFFSTQLDSAAQQTSITKNTIKASPRAAAKTSITLKNINTSRVRNMSNMFADSTVTELDLSLFNTARVRNMTSMFSGCSSLTTIYVSTSWETTVVSQSANMFAGCNNLTNYDEGATDASNAHKNDGGYLTEKVDIAGTLSKAKLAAQSTRFTELIFDAYTSGDEYVVDGVNVISGLTGVDISEEQDGGILLYTSGTIGYILADCAIAFPEDSSYLFAGWDRSMDYTFLGSIETIHFNNIKTSNVINMSFMFWGSTLLDSINLSSFDTSSVTEMTGMFYCCTSLLSLDLSGFNTGSVTRMDGMFQRCSNISTIYVGDDWNINSLDVENFGGSDIFTECESLVGAVAFDSTKVDASMANWETGYLTYKGNE